MGLFGAGLRAEGRLRLFRFFIAFGQNKFWMVIFISSKEQQINEEIRDKQVRLIGADGAQIGVVDIAKAQQMAEPLQ